MGEEVVYEGGNLRQWFKGSRSKDGKPGWVQVVSGKPCARQPGQKTTPKCVSSAKRASMTDAERKSAQRRKRKADPGQPQKTGAAKPTYVSTDSPRKKSMKEGKDHPKNVKGIAKELDKAVEMHKSQASRLRKAGISEENLDEKCWKGYEKKGMKTMFGKRYPNCVKKKIGESVSDWRSEIGYEGKDEVKKLSEDDMKGMSVKSGHKRPTKSGAGMTQKGVEAYRRRNPGSKLKTAVTTEPSKLKKGSKASNRRKSYCARSAGQMKKFPKAAKDPNSRLRQARRRWNC